MSPSQYLHSNPLAEHNSGIALSDKQIPTGGTGNMYQGQGGRAFVQGGGGMSSFHSFDGGKPEDAYARGSYAPVSVGHNSVTRGGGKRKSRKARKSGSSKKKCDCDIVTVFRRGGRHSRTGRTCRMRNSKCKSCRNKRMSRRRSSRHSQQHGGNAAYSVAGAGTDVTRSTTALANPAPYTAYNSCHPVA